MTLGPTSGRNHFDRLLQKARNVLKIPSSHHEWFLPFFHFDFVVFHFLVILQFLFICCILLSHIPNARGIGPEHWPISCFPNSSFQLTFAHPLDHGILIILLLCFLLFYFTGKGWEFWGTCGCIQDFFMSVEVGGTGGCKVGLGMCWVAVGWDSSLPVCVFLFSFYYFPILRLLMLSLKWFLVETEVRFHFCLWFLQAVRGSQS